MTLVIDSSAVIAMLDGKPQGDAAFAVASRAAGLLISAGTWLETEIVIERRRSRTLTQGWGAFQEDLLLTVVDVTERQARIARDAYRDFGKGSGHPAGLNFGDCFAYALARERRVPLLAAGDDFRHTGIEVLP
jgi:ribonuclease VapC